MTRVNHGIHFYDKKKIMYWWERLSVLEKLFYVIKLRGRLYDVHCSPTWGGNEDILAWLPKSSRDLWLYMQEMVKMCCTITQLFLSSVAPKRLHQLSTEKPWRWICQNWSFLELMCGSKVIFFFFIKLIIFSITATKVSWCCCGPMMVSNNGSYGKKRIFVSRGKAERREVETTVTIDPCMSIIPELKWQPLQVWSHCFHNLLPKIFLMFSNNVITFWNPNGYDSMVTTAIVVWLSFIRSYLIAWVSSMSTPLLFSLLSVSGFPFTLPRGSSRCSTGSPEDRPHSSPSASVVSSSIWPAMSKEVKRTGWDKP